MRCACFSITGWRPRRETSKTAEMLQTPRRIEEEQPAIGKGVSKGIADIFTNKGIKYVPHVGYVEKPCVTNRFDPHLHDTQLLWKKIDAQISALFERLPEARSILEGCLHARD